MRPDLIEEGDAYGLIEALKVLPTLYHMHCIKFILMLHLVTT